MDPRWDQRLPHGVLAGSREHLKLGNWGELIKGLFTQMWARCRNSITGLLGQGPGAGTAPLYLKQEGGGQLGPRGRPIQRPLPHRSCSGGLRTEATCSGHAGREPGISHLTSLYPLPPVSCGCARPGVECNWKSEVREPGTHWRHTSNLGVGCRKTSSRRCVWAEFRGTRGGDEGEGRKGILKKNKNYMHRAKAQSEGMKCILGIVGHSVWGEPSGAWRAGDEGWDPRKDQS